jgi:RNA 2',3'-cyclic 3'-phosphodiesterase
MFVAVWPDDVTLRALSSLEVRPAQGLRLVGVGQWHITLRFLGDVADDLVPALVDALGSATADMTGPVSCTVGPGTAWFAGGRVLQLPVAGLDDVADAVRVATVPVVPVADDGEPPFNGHLTLARSKRRLDASARKALAGVSFGATFNVESFDLVASRLSAEGPRYATLARIPLPG